MDNVVIGVLLIIIIALFVERYFRDREIHKERKDLMLGFLSKDATDMAIALKTSDNKPQKETEVTEVNLSDATDDEFDKHIATLNKEE